MEAGCRQGSCSASTTPIPSLLKDEIPADARKSVGPTSPYLLPLGTATTGCDGRAWCSDCAGTGGLCSSLRTFYQARCGPQAQPAGRGGSTYPSRSNARHHLVRHLQPLFPTRVCLPSGLLASYLPNSPGDLGVQVCVQHFTVEARCSAGEQLTSSSGTIRQHPSDAVPALLNSRKTGAVITCSPCLYGVPPR